MIMTVQAREAAEVLIHGAMAEQELAVEQEPAAAQELAAAQEPEAELTGSVVEQEPVVEQIQELAAAQEPEAEPIRELVVEQTQESVTAPLRQAKTG
nr:hypothetical protein [uncultured Sellimonas sp.]